MSVRIIIDSAADLDAESARLLRLEIVPMALQFGKETYPDGRALSNEEFYKKLVESRDFPSTSQPSPADFLTRFQAARQAGDEVVALLLSGELSGTLQSAQVAREMCGGEGICIVDSRTATAGIRLLAEEACRLRDTGAGAAQIAQALEELKGRVTIFAMVDTLEYLRRGGRVTSLQAGLGAVTHLKPVIAVREGTVVVAEKGFGTGAALKRMVGLMEQRLWDDRYPAYLLYSSDKGVADLLRPRLLERGILPRDLRICSVGPIIGTHIGPGAVGMAYICRQEAAGDAER